MLTEKIVDRESRQKLYVQIYAIIKEKIESREWPINTKIPAEDELCKTYEVSKATVRTAVTELEKKGYLKKKQGKGTFVTYTLPNSGIAFKMRLTEDMFGWGVSVRKEILVKGVKKPTEDIKTYLRTDGDIYYVLCKRLINGETAYLEESFIPVSLFDRIEVEDIYQTSFYDLMQEKSAKEVIKIIQTIEITEIRGDAAAILKAKEGTPALLVHRLLVGQDGTPITYTQLTGSGRKNKIKIELEGIA